MVFFPGRTLERDQEGKLIGEVEGAGKRDGFLRGLAPCLVASKTKTNLWVEVWISAHSSHPKGGGVCFFV